MQKKRKPRNFWNNIDNCKNVALECKQRVYYPTACTTSSYAEMEDRRSFSARKTVSGSTNFEKGLTLRIEVSPFLFLPR